MASLESGATMATSPRELSYEERRRAQIEENHRFLSDLGLEASAAARGTQPRPASAAAATAPAALKRKRDAAASGRKGGVATRSRTRVAKTGEPAGRRKSARLQNLAPAPLEDEENFGDRPEEDQGSNVGETWSNDGTDADESAAELTARYKTWKQKHQALVDMEPSEHEGRRRLFLVPTGRVGVNDHTLEHPVKDIGDQYLWGFCDGLFTRIFTHVRPGDIFLMTSSGAGAFNRIARVKETRIVSKADADRFWQRMSFSMGGTSKNNVGFPLLTPIDKPKTIEWAKDDVMRAFGYTDHLQSSRWIKPEKLYSLRGSGILQDCLDVLGLEATLTQEELDLAKSCPIGAN